MVEICQVMLNKKYTKSSIRFFMQLPSETEIVHMTFVA